MFFVSSPWCCTPSISVSVPVNSILVAEDFMDFAMKEFLELLFYHKFHGLAATLGGNGGIVYITRWQGAFEVILVAVAIVVSGYHLTLKTIYSYLYLVSTRHFDIEMVSSGIRID